METTCQKRNKRKARNFVVKKSFKKIQSSERVSRENIRAFKGNRKDTNLLNINFKTRVCKVLQQMRYTKEVTEEQIKAINKYKESPPSFENIVELIYQPKKTNQKKKQIKKSYNTPKIVKIIKDQNQHQVRFPHIFLRLKKLFQSSQIVKKIHQNEGSLVNKLLMLKYLQAMRYTVLGNGQIIKWKQMRQVVRNI